MLIVHNLARFYHYLALFKNTIADYIFTQVSYLAWLEYVND